MWSSKAMRAFNYLIVALLSANAVRSLRDPEALRFFAVTIVVVAAVAAVGSVAAVVLVAVRRFLSRWDNQTPSLGEIRS
jgi:hypothetical protein